MQQRDTPLADIMQALEVHDPAPLEIADNFHFIVALKQLSTIMVIFLVERPVLFVD